ncbi:MAG: anti-phage dCTP deaminase [Burkholderiaceae bacterium]|nr:anti-phage dCTP deaminase [Burkholderiaceae bacterium]
MATGKKTPRSRKAKPAEQLQSAEPVESANTSTTENGSENPIELVFGFVGPTGVDLTKVCASLQSQLKAVNYETKIVRLSELIGPYIGRQLTAKNEYERIERLMTEGTALRRATNQADIVGRLGLAEIRDIRKKLFGDEKARATKRVAYIVRSFKRPEEVSLYRDTYGKAFTLISVYSPRQARQSHLTKLFQGCETGDTKNPEELAVRLITRDYEEDGELGQKMGRTFPLADFFVSSDSRNQLDSQMRRLVRLTFGDPYISPSRDEQGMFFAQASALRSLDLSRQVGAAIINLDGDILATGCNEVPKFGGGLYWDGDEDLARDFELGRDSNATIKAELVEDAVHRLRENGWLSPGLASRSAADLAKMTLYGTKDFFRDSRLFDVIEFGRAVHAEMAAITQAAKLGVPLQQARLFCTTFPCHICARHIVASGISEVVFIEPYEKSRTNELFGDSISVEPHEPSPKRANFRSFVGVAPRRYMDFFAMDGERKNKKGEILDADAIASRPRIKRLVFTYLYIEEKMVEETVRVPQQASIVGDTQ